MYKDLLRELEFYNGNLITIRESIVVPGGEKKPKVVYMEGCVHMLASGTDLIGFVSPRTFKWDASLNTRA